MVKTTLLYIKIGKFDLLWKTMVLHVNKKRRKFHVLKKTLKDYINLLHFITDLLKKT